MTIPKTFASLCLLLFAGLQLSAQSGRVRTSKPSASAEGKNTASVSKRKQLYLLDSAEIRTIFTDERLQEDQVGFINTVRDPFTLFKLGYGKYDSVTFIFTKHYLQLPPERKNIPSPARLEKRNNRYYFRDRLYTGKVIDYYYSGDIKSEAYYEDGLQKGVEKKYDVNGILTLHTTTVSDTLDTEKTSTDSAGNVYYRWKYLLPQKVSVTEYYYPGGSLKTRIETHSGGNLTKKYLSSGIMTDSVYKPWPGMGVAVKTKTTERRERLMKIDEYDVALKKEPGNPAICLARAAHRIETLDYAGALADINACIAIEPQEPDYYGERALVPIYKAAYWDTDNRLKKGEIVEYMRTHPNINIPAADKALMMKDLEKAAVPFSTDKLFKELYKYLKSINF
ncbi:hypothetical protein [Chitinophaga sp. YIM B06452]|uniref:hypothetical protein n=1 Tax=Chitinophaga sp. YIM B06452 TaxID=3082158 RepID=UPI0031FE8B9A